MSARVIDRRRPVAAKSHITPVGRVVLFMLALIGLLIWAYSDFDF